QTVINTNDHRMMILDDVAKHSNASGYGMDSNDDADVKEDVKASLGHAIGVDYKDNVVLDKLDSEEGRKELRTKCQQSESHNSNQKLYNKRSEEHTSELQSRFDLVCRLLLEKKKH